MKKLFALILAAAALLALAACSGESTPAPTQAPDQPAFDREGYKDMLDIAIDLPVNYSDEAFAKVVPQSEIEYNKAQYAERDMDYLDLVRQEYEAAAENYRLTYGDDFKLSYVINSVDEKDEEGIEKYKSFDGYYFRNYNIDLDKISAVTFVKLTVKVEGSLGSNTKDKTIQCFCYDGAWYSFYAVRLGMKL